MRLIWLQPNGVALSPDGRTLYVTDTGCLHPASPDGGDCASANTPRTIFAFDIEARRCARLGPTSYVAPGRTASTQRHNLCP